MANTSNDNRIVNEQVKSLKLGDSVVKSVTLPTTIVEAITAGNDGVEIGGTTANPTVGVKISTETGNGLQLSSTSNKGLYVSKETLGLASAYIPQGNIDISGAQGSTPAEKQKNAAAALLADTVNVQPGYVYNIPYDGTIAESADASAPDITVKVGDNIVVIENNGTRKWDKLSATIDVPVYTGSGAIKVTGTTISLSNGNGLNQNGDTLGITLADNSLSVGATGLKANLKTNGGLNLDTTAGSGGIKVNVDGGGLVIPTDGTNAGKVRVNPGDGLKITTNGANAGKVQVNAGNGLEITDGKVRVSVDDDSISVTASGVSVKTKTGGGIGLEPVNGLKVDVDGATIKIDNNGKVALKAAAAGGLDTSDGTNGVSVKTGGGLQKNGSDGTISVKPNTNKAIEVDASSGVGVVAGSNIAVASTGVAVDIDKSTAITDDTTIEGVITLLGGTITAAS